MEQLSLPWWAPDSVRGVLTDYLTMRAETVTAETRDEDYRYRYEWLLAELGESTPAPMVDYKRIDEVARRAKGIIRDVTIKRRLTFWRAACRWAVTRGVLPATYQPPPVPPWLRNDGVKCADFLTTSQFAQFRLALPPGRFRRYADLAYWTGQHTRDVCSMQRWMLDPGYQWEGSEIRGRWFRRNQKSKVEPCWCVMEPELRVLALEWLAEPGPSERQLVGPLNNLRRTFFEAAARAGTPVVRPNLGLRASHATLLMAREWSYEYVRIVLGHKGEVGLTAIGGSVEERYRVSTAKRPSTLVRHYARQSPEILRPRG